MFYIEIHSLENIPNWIQTFICITPKELHDNFVVNIEKKT